MPSARDASSKTAQNRLSRSCESLEVGSRRSKTKTVPAGSREHLNPLGATHNCCVIWPFQSSNE